MPAVKKYDIVAIEKLRGQPKLPYGWRDGDVMILEHFNAGSIGTVISTTIEGRDSGVNLVLVDGQLWHIPQRFLQLF